MDYAERFGWDRPLYRRVGGASRLCGLPVFHDFSWFSQFRNGRSQFRGGQRLAEFARRQCPQGRTAGLLLTQREDIRGGVWPDDEWYLVVVNIRYYLEEAVNDPAATYFANLRKEIPVTSTSLPPQATANVRQIEVSDALAAIVAQLESASQIPPSVIEALFRLGGPELVVRGREREALEAAMRLLGDAAWDSVLTSDIAIPAAAAIHRVWELRAAVLEQFRVQLREAAWSEGDWQAFFENEPWIFGLGLDFQFLHLIEGQPYFGGKRFTGRGGTVGDYLMASGGSLRFTVIVEIKTPGARLLAPGDYRNNAYPPSSEMTGAVAQLQLQASKWASTSQQSESRDELDRRHTFTYAPRGILVIGRTEEFLDGGSFDRPRIHAFEAYRRSLRDPEILTFDELFERVAQTIASAP